VDRLRPYLGLTAVATASLFTLNRVYEGGRWVVPVFGSALVALVLVALLRRTAIPLAIRAAIALTAGLFFFGYFIVPESIPARGIFPRPMSVIRAGVEAWDRSLEMLAPVKTDPGLILLAAAAAWIGVIFSEAALMWGHPIMGAHLWIALFAYASATGVETGRQWSVALFLVAFMVLLLTSGAGSREVSSRSGSATAVGLAPGTMTMAGAALAVCLFLPQVIPGFRAAPLVSLPGKAPASRVEVSPMTQIRPRLSLTPNLPVFEVRAPRPPEGISFYWRLLALDKYSGEAWHSAADYRATGGKIDSSETARGRTVRVTQNFHISALGGPWIPAAFQPVNIDGADAQFDPQGSSIVTPERLATDLRYTIVSVVPNPTADALKTARPPTSLRGYRGLSGVQPEIGALATQLTRDKGTQYEKVLAISDHLRKFRYDERVPPGHSGSELRRFLFQTKAGYCEQFSGAMAVLVRSLGIPARVAVGFLPGDYDAPSGTYNVRTRHAHAWTEVYFDRIGWVPFEPTPRDIAVPAAYATTVAVPAPAEVPAPEPVVPPPAAAESQPQPASPPTTQPDAGVTEPGGSRVRIPVWAWGAIAVLTVTLMTLGSLALIKKSKRRSFYRADRPPPDRIRFAFMDVEAGAADLSQRWEPAETPAEFAMKLQSSMSLDGSSTRGLVDGYQQSVYGVDGTSPEVAQQAAAAARRLRREMWEDATFWGKLALACSPRSLLRPLHS
jgi:transglutaminase-like putative cysteine protease